ncbi:hypothetical protein IEO21_10528 [Rhodonia placenta]|uniref:Uncharacterized protein n=1 Tax=Rhodonia placenta TaxID=104341 RepID=A0A8H7NSA2_9APHY|nr:hypothetical protein IEO21_10528 [Postia placenta]
MLRVSLLTNSRRLYLVTCGWCWPERMSPPCQRIGHCSSTSCLTSTRLTVARITAVLFPWTSIRLKSRNRRAKAKARQRTLRLPRQRQRSIVSSASRRLITQMIATSWPKMRTSGRIPKGMALGRRKEEVVTPRPRRLRKRGLFKSSLRIARTTHPRPRTP